MIGGLLGPRDLTSTHLIVSFCRQSQQNKEGKESWMIIRERWIELGLGFFFMLSSSSLSLHKQIAVIQSTMLLAPLELQSVVGRVGCHRLFFLRRPQASSPSSRASSSRSVSFKSFSSATFHSSAHFLL